MRDPRRPSVSVSFRHSSVWHFTRTRTCITQMGVAAYLPEVYGATVSALVETNKCRNKTKDCG